MNESSEIYIYAKENKEAGKGFQLCQIPVKPEYDKEGIYLHRRVMHPSDIFIMGDVTEKEYDGSQDTLYLYNRHTENILVFHLTDTPESAVQLEKKLHKVQMQDIIKQLPKVHQCNFNPSTAFEVLFMGGCFIVQTRSIEKT